MAFSRVRNSLSRSKTARALLHPALVVRRALAQKFDAARNRMIENLQQSLAEDPVVHVKEFEGSFLVDRRSHLFARVALDGAYEPELAAVCVAHLDAQRDAIDVGANVGFYTNLMARRLPSRRVLAIEPTANALAKLRSNIDRNGIGARTIVFEGIASDREGTRTLHTVAGKEEYSSLGALAHPSIAGQRFEEKQVRATTIDALVASHRLDPGFIKIDVEGAEHEALRGAEATLKSSRPVVLAELSAELLARNGTSADALIALLTELDYRLVDPLDPGAPFVARDYGDVLCLPRERG